MKKSLALTFVMFGISALSVWHPCKWNWLNPFLCTVHDIPKDPPPYYPYK